MNYYCKKLLNGSIIYVYGYDKWYEFKSWVIIESIIIIVVNKVGFILFDEI